MNRNKTETFLLVTSAGLLGATLALVFAPQSGRRTRRQIRRVAGDYTDRAREFREDMNERMEELVAEWRELGGKGLGKGDNLRESLLKTLRSSRDLISSKISRLETEGQK